MSEKEESSSIGSLIHQSYTHTKTQLSDSVSAFREEFSVLYEKTGNYLVDKIVSPVNNFLKDLSQIENEFQLEYTKTCIGAEGTTGVSTYMEENY